MKAFSYILVSHVAQLFCSFRLCVLLLWQPPPVGGWSSFVGFRANISRTCIGVLKNPFLSAIASAFDSLGISDNLSMFNTVLETLMGFLESGFSLEAALKGLAVVLDELLGASFAAMDVLKNWVADTLSAFNSVLSYDLDIPVVCFLANWMLGGCDLWTMFMLGKMLLALLWYGFALGLLLLHSELPSVGVATNN